MRLTQKELIRLQKETHLLEHGFYDKEVKAYIDNPESDWDGITKEVDNSFGNAINAWRKVWFKQKFPEFFEEEKK